MADPWMLSRGKLATFLICQRRFQLRHLVNLPWPSMPLDDDVETAVTRGQQFHQLLERHFLNVDIQPAGLHDTRLRQWWHTFVEHGPSLPQGRFLPELSLTVPLDGHLLIGRFDLVVVGTADGAPFAHVFDWKTSRPRPEGHLRDDWQTRLYLALLAEGGQALQPGGPPLPPDQIAVTYWYVSEPDAPRTIRYNADWHTQNWAEIRQIAADIDALTSEPMWPLTENWDHCRACAYQVICGRQGAGQAHLTDDEPEAPEPNSLSLEPDTP